MIRIETATGFAYVKPEHVTSIESRGSDVNEKTKATLPNTIVHLAGGQSLHTRQDAAKLLADLSPVNVGVNA